MHNVKEGVLFKKRERNSTQVPLYVWVTLDCLDMDKKMNVELEEVLCEEFSFDQVEETPDLRKWGVLLLRKK